MLQPKHETKGASGAKSTLSVDLEQLGMSSQGPEAINASLVSAVALIDNHHHPLQDLQQPQQQQVGSHQPSSHDIIAIPTYPPTT